MKRSQANSPNLPEIRANGRLTGNTVTGGAGGDGGSNGGQGGYGGSANSGGGATSFFGITRIEFSTVAGNIVRSGDGGAGGLGAPGHTGGTGGSGGLADAGGLNVSDLGALVSFDSTVSGNSVTGGKGGDGGNGGNELSNGGVGNGGNGGQGGAVFGGGIEIGSTTFDTLSFGDGSFNDLLSNTTIADNTIKAGNGGAGGTGGAASVGTAGNGGNGGNSGIAQGAGAYFDVPFQDSVNNSQGPNPDNQFGVLLVNDTVAYNKATQGMGGAGGDAGAPPPSGGTLGSAGFSGGNTPSQGGGIVNAANEGVSLINTLVALNTANQDTDYFGEVDNTDHNLIGDATGSFGFSTANGDQLGTKTNPINPLLGQLADNGGLMVGAPGDQTAFETITLLAGSPAIAAGDATATATDFTGPIDQRGDPREIDGTIDIGAFELGPPAGFDQPPGEGS